MEKLNFNLEVTEHGNNPFDYWIVDDFLDINVAKDISQQFLNYEENDWFGYDFCWSIFSRFIPFTVSFYFPRTISIIWH